MNTDQIKIENLKCGGCASTIEDALLKVEGVKEVNIVHNESLVQISYEHEPKHAEYIKVLSRLGYPPEGTGNTFQKVKSYVSCAIGKISS